MNSSLADNFDTYFSVNLATTEALKQQIYQIRYRVYCEEFQYEPTSEECGGKEQDTFDEYALHCIIHHKPSGYPAGCIRLVPGSLHHDTALLPMEHYCSESLDHEMLDRMQLQRHQMCEISRLAVDRLFRRRSNERHDRFGTSIIDFSEEEVRLFPLIAVSAFMAATSMSLRSQKEYAFAMMEPFLPRMLKRSGFVFTRVGKEMDYHGIRAPYYIPTNTVVESIKPELRMLYHSIDQALENQFDWAS